jgi:hypothetical protein
MGGQSEGGELMIPLGKGGRGPTPSLEACPAVAIRWGDARPGSTGRRRSLAMPRQKTLALSPGADPFSMAAQEDVGRIAPSGLRKSGTTSSFRTVCACDRCTLCGDPTARQLDDERV